MGVSKIFTFHSTVKSAASFVAEGGEGVRSHLPAFSAFHVSGEMPAAHRERLMRDFRNIPKAVMSNARCLTEGVDVPAVDMVAFLSPKKSKVDIVQAIGRAMRKSEGKETGYVLVPLYLEQKEGESLDKAIERANFEEIWDVLQSLKEQDEILAQLITQTAQSRGAGKGWDDSNFTDRIDFTGPALALESIRSSVTTHILEHLESSWDVNFGKLQKFKEEHGHCRVKKRSQQHKQLGLWTAAQRSNYSQGKLSAERIFRLEALGFEWDPFSSDWDRLYNVLVAYKAEHGDCRVPAIYKNLKELGIWVSNQRSAYSTGTLNAERISKLQALGFEWDPFNSDWERLFMELEDYKNNHGDCLVPQRFKENKTLGAWVNIQRLKRSKGSLSIDRIARLDALSFEWDPLSSDWERSFSALTNHYSKYGNCRVSSHSENYRELGYWVSRQRKFYSNRTLSQERISRLEALGFEWDPSTADWEKFIQELISFKTLNGHCRVPYDYKINKELGNWASRQRKLFFKGTLSSKRIAQLETLGFEWDPFTSDWESSFNELKAYKAEHGHCRVPKKSVHHKQLGIWVSTQRSNYSAKKLSQDRISRLETLGFEWVPKRLSSREIKTA